MLCVCGRKSRPNGRRKGNVTQKRTKDGVNEYGELWLNPVVGGRREDNDQKGRTTVEPVMNRTHTYT